MLAKLASCLLGAAALTSAALASQALTATRAVDSINYDSAARSFLARHGRPDATPETLTIEQLVETEFLSAPLGVFELAIPRRSLATPSEPARFQSLCVNLLDAQKLWIEWAQEESADTKRLQSDLLALRRWVTGWKTKDLAVAAEGEPRGLLEILQAPEAIQELSARLVKATCEGGLLGKEQKCDPVRIALFPSRGDFVEMLCVTGFLRAPLKPYFWVEGIERWHEFDLPDENIHGLAMAFPAESVTPATYSAGSRLDEESDKVLGEQITQLSLNSMIRRLYDDGLPPTVVHSMSINMVIELFGEIDTRADGHLEGRSTSAREVFVPGGRSEGGILPMASADNRWRAEHGKDHYLRTLRQAQKDGSKEKGRSKIKHANFVLHSHDEVVRKLIYGPFLGSKVEPLEAPPRALAEDQSEFLRAYRVAFVYWLQEGGAGNEKLSKQKYAAWLSKLADLDSVEAFEQSFTEIYEVPLSSAELDKNCLEGRFLLWLTKQKGA